MRLILLLLLLLLPGSVIANPYWDNYPACHGLEGPELDQCVKKEVEWKANLTPPVPTQLDRAREYGKERYPTCADKANLELDMCIEHESNKQGQQLYGEAVQKINEPQDNGWFIKYPDGRIEITKKPPKPLKKKKGQVTFSDGRVCNKCTVILDRGVVVAILDRDGYEWQWTPGTTMMFDKHPYLRRYAQGMAYGMAAAGQAYGQAVQQQAQTQQMNRPRFTNCNANSYGYGTSVNCMSY